MENEPKCKKSSERVQQRALTKLRVLWNKQSVVVVFIWHIFEFSRVEVVISRFFWACFSKPPDLHVMGVGRSAGRMEVWQCGSVEVWQWGSVEVWQCGSVEVCQYTCYRLNFALNLRMDEGYVQKTYAPPTLDKRNVTRWPSAGTREKKPWVETFYLDILKMILTPTSPKKLLTREGSTKSMNDLPVIAQRALQGNA